MTKQEMEDLMIQKRMEIDPAIEEIYTCKSSGKDDLIILLESNTNTCAAGIMLLRFDPIEKWGITLSTMIMEVTPEEFEAVIKKEIPLPYGWELDRLISRFVRKGE